MDLNTIAEVAHPKTRAQLPVWTAGDAWLAGGTWLFSEPQAHLTRLIDLTDLRWPALCRAYLASFKIWKTATVGGNLCMSLPAGPMISLTSALDGICTIWKADGSERKIDVADFVTGDQRNVLAPGDLLRQIDIPLAALKRHTAFRQISLTPVGRSAALLIGSVPGEGGLALTVTASTARPVQLSFAAIPQAKELREAILQRIPDALYHDDIHGKQAWRKHVTLRLAEEIRSELQGAG